MLMGNNPRVMLPDLNQEPLVQPQNLLIELESIGNEFESPLGRIEQRQTLISTPLANSSSVVRNETSLGSHKCLEKNCTDLIAQALEIESFHSKDPCYNSGNGDFFDCNVCWSMASEPVLTCCGHLFCWPCFYNLPYEQSNVKECPVCGGDVMDTSVIPVYGNGDSNSSRKRKRTGLDVPPRPNAKRVEAASQHHVTRGLSNSQIEQRIQQLTSIVTRLAERGLTSSSSAESSGNQHVDSLNFSQILWPGPTASSSFVSSALDSSLDSEMLAENPDEFYSIHYRRSSHEESPRSGTEETETSDNTGTNSSHELSPALPLWPSIFPHGENLVLDLQFNEAPFSATSSTPPRSPDISLFT